MSRPTDEKSDGMSMLTNVGLLLMAAALLVHGLFDNYQLRRANQALESQYNQQVQPLEAAEALREQLQGIAGATAQLAEQGNPNAIMIRDQLARQGITIRPPSE